MLDRLLRKEFAAELLAEDTDVLLERLEATDEGRDGKGLSNSCVISRKSRSSPPCICRAIIGKLFSNSENDLISFFLGSAVDEDGLSSAGAVALRLLSAIAYSSDAGMIVIASSEPTNGFVI